MVSDIEKKVVKEMLDLRKNYEKDREKADAEHKLKILEIDKKIEGIDHYLKTVNHTMANDDPDKLKSQKNDLVMSPYPKTGTREDKIIYVIRSAQRAVLMREIKNMLKDNEGPWAKEILRSLFYWLQALVNEKRVVTSKVGLSNKHTYYALPEFLSKGKLKPEYLPNSETWGNLPESRILELTKNKWQ
jgi:hypothetical protein